MFGKPVSSLQSYIWDKSNTFVTSSNLRWPPTIGFPNKLIICHVKILKDYFIPYSTSVLTLVSSNSKSLAI